MFDTHFQAVLADTDLAKRIHYNIRYKVFCEETGFEDFTAFPDAEEKDRFDQNAIHFLVRERTQGTWIAAMRLILGRYGELPSEGFSELHSTKYGQINLKQVAEVSRLCMLQGFRRRGPERAYPYQVIDGKTGETKYPQRERRKDPEILLGLLRAIYAWGKDNDVRFLNFLVNPALARVLTRMHIPLMEVGKACEYRGIRTPYLANVNEGRNALLNASPEIAKMMCRNNAYERFSELQKSDTSYRKKNVLKYPTISR